MKANKAPEKIYISPKVFNMGEYVTKVLTTKYEDNIEYTRTDAFIEKAVAWVKEHKEDVETEDNGIAGWIPDCFIEDFVKFMRE